jgi:hypothetical protein
MLVLLVHCKTTKLNPIYSILWSVNIYPSIRGMGILNRNCMASTLKSGYVAVGTPALHSEIPMLEF